MGKQCESRGLELYMCVCEKRFYGGFALTYVNLGHDEFCFLI